MRTFLLVGIAALAAISAEPVLAKHDGHSTTRVESRVIVVDGNSGEDAAVYRSAADRAPTESDYRGRWQRIEGRSYRGDEGRYSRDGRDYDNGRYDDGGRYYDEDRRYADARYGYDYIQGAPTTIVIPGQPVIIEETETTYETVTIAAPRIRSAPRAAHRPAVRRRPSCNCR